MSGDVSGGTITWRELWAETSAGVGDRAQARWLCEVASGSVDGDEFLGRLDEPRPFVWWRTSMRCSLDSGPVSRSSTYWVSGASARSPSPSIGGC